MSNLNLGIEIRDFDLERMGFSLSVLDESKKRQASEAYLRMTLLELHAFLNALKAAESEIALTTYDSNGVNKLPPLKGLAGREVEPAERRGEQADGRRVVAQAFLGARLTGRGHAPRDERERKREPTETRPWGSLLRP